MKICGNVLFSGEYSEYTLVEDIPGFMNDYGMGLAFATTEVSLLSIMERLIPSFCQVRTETEDWVYPGLSFIAEFGGALGMFLGFSFYMFWDCGEMAAKRWCGPHGVQGEKE